VVVADDAVVVEVTAGFRVVVIEDAPDVDAVQV
jgi:hypothetical protein